MPGLPVTVVPAPGLRRRFELASAAEPLCALTPAAREELGILLDGAAALEELPGKWQAALLRAESVLRGAPPSSGGGCCAGGGQ